MRSGTPADVREVTPAVLRSWSLPTPAEGKESRGHVVVVAGTSRTPGAAILAAEASLRAGAGKLTIATAASVAGQVAAVVPEALVEPLPETPGGHLAGAAAEVVAGLVDQADALLVGTGLLDDTATMTLMDELLPRVTGPLVIDATATAYLGRRPDGAHHLAERVVLTVNPKELSSVAGCEVEDVESRPVEIASAVARSCRVVVLLGGTEKHVAGPGRSAWTYAGGSPGLGVSGSGDVQAGVVAGLLARGAEPEQAATWAAFVHAKVGERLAAETGVLGHLAREQPGHVPLVLRELG